MFRLVVLAAALVCVLGAPRTLQRPRYAPGSRIVGGNEVPMTQIPYQLSFQYNGRHYCGASIISADWAVTAAHCADGASPSQVVMNSGNVDASKGDAHPASQVKVNEAYDPFSIDYDIALVKVSIPFKTDAANSAAIALTNTRPAAGTPSFVSGWGTTSSGGSAPTNVRGVTVPVVAWAECNSAYSGYGGITQRMICAGLKEGGKDSCQGDSGGPMVADGKLVGIVSWGAGCAAPNYPGVYSDVASMRDWVKQNSGV